MIFTANAFFFCAFPREFCFEECLQRQQSALLWGRGGFDQLRHVVPQGGSLGCQETKQSSGCLESCPHLAYLGVIKRSSSALTLSKQPQAGKICISKWIFSSWIELVWKGPR